MIDKYDVNNMLSVTEALNDMKYSAWEFDDNNNVVFKYPPLHKFIKPIVHFFKTTEKEKEKLKIEDICVLPMTKGCSYTVAKTLVKNIKLKDCYDWRIPSVDEFIEIKNILHNRIGYSLDSYEFPFWTSSENLYKGTAKIISNIYNCDDVWDRHIYFNGCILIVR